MTNVTWFVRLEKARWRFYHCVSVGLSLHLEQKVLFTALSIVVSDCTSRYRIDQMVLFLLFWVNVVSAMYEYKLDLQTHHGHCSTQNQTHYFKMVNTTLFKHIYSYLYKNLGLNMSICLIHTEVIWVLAILLALIGYILSVLTIKINFCKTAQHNKIQSCRYIWKLHYISSYENVS